MSRFKQTMAGIGNRHHRHHTHCRPGQYTRIWSVPSFSQAPESQANGCRVNGRRSRSHATARRAVIDSVPVSGTIDRGIDGLF
jgi:hypothetical protein